MRLCRVKRRSALKKQAQLAFIGDMGATIVAENAARRKRGFMEKQLSIKLNTEPPKSCAFTGHRVLDKDFSPKKLRKILQSLLQQGVDTFYNGMAIGLDIAAAKILLSLRKHYNFRLIACIPCVGQDNYYSTAEKRDYENIMKQTDEQIYLSDHYFNGCMLLRNRYMADRADVLVAYCKKDSGGTAYTVRYFQKKYPEKEIVFL